MVNDTLLLVWQNTQHSPSTSDVSECSERSSLRRVRLSRICRDVSQRRLRGDLSKFDVTSAILQVAVGLLFICFLMLYNYVL